MYRFNEPVLGSRAAGHEVDAKFLVTAPKGVTLSVTAARFFPGAALRALFSSAAWSLAGTVSVGLGP
jgi:hypothetical protein